MIFLLYFMNHSMDISAVLYVERDLQILNITKEEYIGILRIYTAAILSIIDVMNV